MDRNKIQKEIIPYLQVGVSVLLINNLTKILAPPKEDKNAKIQIIKKLDNYKRM
jgi:hypothetical protein